MLKRLTISNFRLVAALDVALQGGLTVVTGESGAGKSILLNALALVLGERASPALIRPGAQRADVVAEFDVAGNASALECLSSRELGDPDQPERCLLRRVVGGDGRSRAFINGTPVNLDTLRQLAGGLVDIHSQDANQRLTHKTEQLAMLDAYAVRASDGSAMATAHRAWQKSEQALRELQERVAGAQNRADLLSYQLAELDALALGDGEFEALDSVFRRLSQAQEIQETVLGAMECLANLDELRRIGGALAAIDDSHPRLDDARQALDSALELSDDALRELRAYQQALEADPEHLAEIEERLNLIQELARKHRVHPQALRDHWCGLRAEFSAFGASREDEERLREQTASRRAQFEAAAKKVSAARRSGATRFADKVSARMDGLGIKGGCLRVHFEAARSEGGLESAEFLVTANPKYPPGSLKKVASGGERARISLAIKVVAAEKARLPCLVLDEADVGVGAAAGVIGRLLRQLGRRAQVICVTHAPPVAALGDAHLQVSKDDEQDVRIEVLDEDGRIKELARMLAGAEASPKSLAYAQTLRRQADRQAGG